MSGCIKDDGCNGDCEGCDRLHCDECRAEYPVTWPRGLCACGGNIVAEDHWADRPWVEDENRLRVRDVI